MLYAFNILINIYVSSFGRVKAQKYSERLLLGTLFRVSVGILACGKALKGLISGGFRWFGLYKTFIYIYSLIYLYIYIHFPYSAIYR